MRRVGVGRLVRNGSTLHQCNLANRRPAGTGRGFTLSPLRHTPGKFEFEGLPRKTRRQLPNAEPIQPGIDTAQTKQARSQHAETNDEGKQRLYCVTVDPTLEDLINGYIDRGPSGTTMSIPPQVANRIATAVSETAQPLLGASHQMVVLTSPTVRAQLKQILEPHLPGVVVLSYNEVVKGLDVESMGLIQLEEPVGAPAA